LGESKEKIDKYEKEMEIFKEERKKLKKLSDDLAAARSKLSSLEKALEKKNTESMENEFKTKSYISQIHELKNTYSNFDKEREDMHAHLKKSKEDLTHAQVKSYFIMAVESCYKYNVLY
jgi:chromosome segregation ATPase